MPSSGDKFDIQMFDLVIGFFLAPLEQCLEILLVVKIPRKSNMLYKPFYSDAVIIDIDCINETLN